MARTWTVPGAVAALAMLPLSAFADPPITVQQELLDEIFELNNVDFNNAAAVDVDAATVQDDPDGVNEESGHQNLQKNSSEYAPEADSASLQSLKGNSFNRDSAELSDAQAYNTATVNISASDDITDNVGVNTAAGAFNLQQNSAVIAIVAGGTLAQSTADASQDSQLNASVVNGATNEVMSTINLDTPVSGNVGVNSVSGVGNEQINNASITRSF